MELSAEIDENLSFLDACGLDAQRLVDSVDGAFPSHKQGKDHEGEDDDITHGKQGQFLGNGKLLLFLFRFGGFRFRLICRGFRFTFFGSYNFV